MLKMLTAAAASFAMLSAAAAADLPRREPPPPAPAPYVGKAPIGKFPVGKYPAPQPVVTKGWRSASLTLERWAALNAHPITALTKMPRFGGAFHVDWKRYVELARQSRGLQ